MAAWLEEIPESVADREEAALETTLAAMPSADVSWCGGASKPPGTAGKSALEEAKEEAAEDGAVVITKEEAAEEEAAADSACPPPSDADAAADSCEDEGGPGMLCSALSSTLCRRPMKLAMLACWPGLGAAAEATAAASAAADAAAAAAVAEGG